MAYQRRYMKAGLFVAFTMASIPSGPAVHAQVAQQGGVESNQTGLEEIVVTAQRREENVQRIPITIETITATELQDAGVRDVTQLYLVSPDIQLYNNSGGTVISIRGVRANSNAPSSESPVVLNLDGAYIGRMNGTDALFFDVNRMEVLEGPQGTLYGRNASAGAINIITNRPAFQFGGVAELEVGNYDLTRVFAAVNLPVSDTLAFRVAAQTYDHSGYMKSGLDDAKENEFRISGLWNPTSNQELYFTADDEHIGGKGSGASNVVRGGPGVFVPANPYDDSYYYGSTAPYASQDIEVSGEMAQYVLSFDSANLTVQGSHRNMRQGDVFDGEGNISSYPAYSRSESLETRLASNSGSPLQWVTGLYGYKEYDDGALFVLLPPTYTTPFYTFNPNRSDDTSYAGFGQATWAVADRLRLTAGLRWTHDHKAGDIGTHTPSVNVDVLGVGNWSALNYRAGVEFDVRDQNMIYGSVATGYKAGGFSFGFTPKYNPEHLTAYEVGSKNRFLDNKLQVNWSAYYYRYTNFETQYNLTVVNPVNGETITTGTVTNAGSANIYGSSLDLQWALTPDDRITSTLTYLHAYFGADNLTNLGLEDYSGQPIQDSPLWSGLLSYDHFWPLLGGRLDGQVRVKYTDDRHIFQNAVLSGTPPGGRTNPDVVAAPYTYLNFLLRYDSAGSKWNVAGYVNNSTNRITYNNAAYSYDGGKWQVTAQPAQPRTFGVIVGIHF